MQVDSYVVVPSPTGKKWFPSNEYGVVLDAFVSYMTKHPDQFAENGDVILDAVDISDLVLAREELGLTIEQVPEELFVGVVPRQVDMVMKKTDMEKPTVIKNSLLIGNAQEMSNTIMSALWAYYQMPEAHDHPHDCEDQKCDHSHDNARKTPKQRAEERKRRRRKDKR